MRLFTCSVCQQVLFFENTQCLGCGSRLGYLPGHFALSALEYESGQGAQTVYRARTPEAEGQRFRLCANVDELSACNWTIPVDDPSTAPNARYCFSCSLNQTIPDLTDDDSKAAWVKLETAKRRLLFTLMCLGLPIERRGEGDSLGLAFDFLKDGADQPVFTGHSDGLITINIAEADDPFREKMRVQMEEAYRTVLGHFRHEIGHYYWDRLIANSELLQPYRELFGDEQASYQDALQFHYENGAPVGWEQSYVSAYATMHPWEDWAETFAHYLHMVDTLDTARAYGLALRPKTVDGNSLPPVQARRIDIADFDDMIAAWFPLTVALNSMNRSMGLPDSYPFVLPEKVIEKLRFVQRAIDSVASPSNGYPNDVVVPQST